MYLVFDTETNGLPKDYKAPITNHDNWPRIIQLAFSLFNSEGKPFLTYKELIKPDGWVIPKEKFWIDNGYSTETNLEKGVPIEEAVFQIVKAMQQAKVLIAHNMDFDKMILGAEMNRLQINPGVNLLKICTKELSTEYCKLKKNKFSKYDSGSEYKWPKLEELHMKLFKESFEGAHDALADVNACARCFFELMKLEIIQRETVYQLKPNK